MLSSRKPKLSRCPRERAFLHKWLKRKGVKYINKMKFIPELILMEYETHLFKHTYFFPKYFTSEERLKVIGDYIEYHLHIYPEYKKILKITGLYNKDVAILFGYSSLFSWNSSYNRLKYIKAIVKIVDKYKEELEIIFNPT